MLTTELTHNNDTVWTLKLTGVVDTNTHAVMWHTDSSASLFDQMVAAHARILYVDLTDVSLIDSLGLRLLLNAYKESTVKNISIVLKNPNMHLQRIFQIMRFDLAFPMEFDHR